jgi:hypothetical protein
VAIGTTAGDVAKRKQEMDLAVKDDPVSGKQRK